MSVSTLYAETRTRIRSLLDGVYDAFLIEPDRYVRDTLQRAYNDIEEAGVKLHRAFILIRIANDRRESKESQ